MKGYGVFLICLTLMTTTSCQLFEPAEVTLKKAVEANDLKAAENLLIDGISPNAVDRDGRPMLHLACSAFSPEMVELLVKYDGNIHGRNRKGETALHHVSQLVALDLVHLLESIVYFVPLNLKEMPNMHQKQYF